MNRSQLESHLSRLGGLIPIQGESFVPLGADEVEKLEDQVGAALPEDYRLFLELYGASTFRSLASIRAAGSLPEWLSNDGLLPFGSFYGVNRESYDFPDLLFCAEQFREELPSQLLPIADAGNDDQICIQLFGNRVGRVLYWDSQSNYERSDDDAGASLPADISENPKLFYIAYSFEDLLVRIEPFDDEDH